MNSHTKLKGPVGLIGKVGMTISLLLGAGASFDAKLPMSFDLTSRLLDATRSRSRKLMHFVYGGMLMQAAARGNIDDDDVRVDVESLFNAVDGLIARAAADTAPFVMSWHPLIAQVEAEPPNFFDTIHVRQEFEAAFRHHGRDHVHGAHEVRNLVHRFTSEQPERAPRGFQDLSNEMVEALSSLLAVSEPADVSYLKPLLDLHSKTGSLTIATLNYDQTVEVCASANGVPIDDGIDSWPDPGLSFRPGAVRLLKVHGSVDWMYDDSGGIRRRKSTDPPKRSQSVLIFGGRNKLRADGPFLELLWEWKGALADSDHVVVIGYSFRDDHINSLLEAWTRRKTPVRVTIVNPAFDGQGGSVGRRLLINSNEAREAAGRRADPRNPSSDDAAGAPVRIVRQGACEALSWLFGDIDKWPTPVAFR